MVQRTETSPGSCWVQCPFRQWQHLSPCPGYDTSKLAPEPTHCSEFLECAWSFDHYCLYFEKDIAILTHSQSKHLSPKKLNNLGNIRFKVGNTKYKERATCWMGGGRGWNLTFQCYIGFGFRELEPFLSVMEFRTHYPQNRAPRRVKHFRRWNLRNRTWGKDSLPCPWSRS